MSSPFGPLVAIAGRGRVREELPELERQLIASRLEYRFVEADEPEHATGAAREALDKGERFLVAVGGDDVMRAVLGALVVDGKPVSQDVVLGLIAAGSGADLPRTFGLPGDVIKAARHLRGDNTYSLDAGWIRSHGEREGEHVERPFVNIAQVGFGSESTRRALRRRRLGRLGRFTAFWGAYVRQRPFFANVRADRKSFGRRANNILVANCQYRDGMRISPRSYPGDGLFDVQIAVGPRSDAFRLIPKMYRGEHVPSPSFKEMRGRVIVVDADRPLWVEADGEIIGKTPASFEVVPQAIRLKV
ncbi:MAG TPA: diacylglycerol kinase family protein [Actinomycetota bacterium]|nr:diacylglycerol kinase family protein [Actinomycetota bacterium]